MNYHVVGPPIKCGWHLVRGNDCPHDAEILFVIRMYCLEPPTFRFYCAKHALEQQEIEARA